MSDVVRQLLPAGLIALVLHTILLSWRLNQEKDTVLPINLPAQRIAVSLGVKKITPQKPTPPDKKQPDTKNERAATVQDIRSPEPIVPEKRKEKLQKIMLPKKHLVQQKKTVSIPKEKTRPDRAKIPVDPVQFVRKKSESVSLKAEHLVDSNIQPDSPQEKIIPTSVATQNIPQSSSIPEGNILQSKVKKGIVKAKPLYSQNPKPKYPSRARQRQWQGVVLLEVEVLLDGSAGRVTVHESSGYKLLDKSGIAAVKKWRFVPGMVNGVAQTMKVIVPLNFKIQ